VVSRNVNDVQIECVRGDISAQDDIQAVVNAANAQLRTGGGVAGAIHGAAGPKLEEATRKCAPIEPGEAVITDAFELPNDYVIHCLGPVYGKDQPEDELLASCYRESLARAEENDVESVAFPSISTGAFGYPMEDAADVALNTVIDEVENLDSVRTIRFVLWGEEAHEIHVESLKEKLD
jgi:O-acetyl-ADP-ribose deacetylase (regulator of RNase III)